MSDHDPCPPATIESVINRLQSIKAEYGNLEVRLYEGWGHEKSGKNTYPTFVVVPYHSSAVPTLMKCVIVV